MLTEADKIYIKECNEKIRELAYRKYQLRNMFDKCTSDINYYKERIKEVKENLPLNEDLSNVESNTILLHLMNKHNTSDKKLALNIGSGYDKILHPDSKSKVEKAIITSFGVSLLQLALIRKEQKLNQKKKTK